MSSPQKVFLDTNIALDLLTKRAPFIYDAEKIFTLADKEKIQLFISADSFTTIAYFLNKYHNRKKALKLLIQFKTLVNILPVNEKVIDMALVSKAKDFEDAVQIAAAVSSGMDCIITRDEKGFSQAEIAVFSPKSFLKVFY